MIWAIRARWKISGLNSPVTALILAGRRERAEELIDRCDADNPATSERCSRTWFEQSAGSSWPGCRISVRGVRSREEPGCGSFNLAMLGSLRPFPSRCRRWSASGDATNRRFRPGRGLRARPDWSTRRRRSRVRSASPATQIRRKGGLVLFVALTREEAEERHRTRQDYALAMRRPDESLLVVRHHNRVESARPRAAPKPDIIPAQELSRRSARLARDVSRTRRLRENRPSETCWECGPSHVYDASPADRKIWYTP